MCLGKKNLLVIAFSLFSIMAYANYFVFLMNNTPEKITVNNICAGDKSTTGCETMNFPVEFAPFQRYKTFVFNYNEGIKFGHDYTLHSKFNLPVDNTMVDLSVSFHGDWVGSYLTLITANINGIQHVLLDDNNSSKKILPGLVGSYSFNASDDSKYTLYASAQHDYPGTQGIDSIYLALDKDYKNLEADSNPNTISVVSYNIQAFPFYIGAALDLNKMTTRMDYLATRAKIRNYDLISFQEAWDKDARIKLINDLKGSYPYSIDPIPENIHGLALNSGLLVLSKYPITKSQFLNYQDYQTMVDTDKLTNKGALYFQINKQGKLYNFITTHTQAQNYSAAIYLRQDEFRLIRDKIINDPVLNISRGEPLIVFGDLNTDYYNSNEFSFLRDTLNLNALYIKNTLNLEPKYSYDSKINLMIDPNAATEQGMYDYIVPVNGFELPVKFDSQLTPIRALDYAPMYDKSNNVKLYNRGDVEISDHFMLQSKFVFKDIGS